MKKLLFAIILLACAFEGEASHATGGEITYEYIGDSTNIPYHYMITLTLYRRNESNSATLGNTFTVSITSSCFGNQNLTVTRIDPLPGLAAGDGGMILTDLGCINRLDPAQMNVSRHIYKAAVVLPGKCADFKFTYSLCCRNANISNLVNPASTSIYIETSLNNLQFSNSSPRFFKIPLLKVCLGQNVVSYFGGPDPDGDSVHYLFTDPLTAANSPVPFATAYSIAQPISTTGGVSFNSKKGILRYTPSTVENDIVVMTSSEYRFDSTSSFWVLVGEVQREFMINIVGTCSPDTSNWVNEFNDTLSFQNSLSCGDSLIHLTTGKLFLRSSLSENGSDFALLSSQNTLIPIIAAGSDVQNAADPMATNFWLKLNEPIYYNDTLTLVTRVGNDLNTLLNGCNEELQPGDSISFVVTDCSTAVGIDDHQSSATVSIFPNPVENELYLNLPEGLSSKAIRVYDLTGKELLVKKEVYGKIALQLEFLPKGIYLLKVSTEHGDQVHKIEKL